MTTGRDERLNKSADGMADKLYVHMLILALHVSGTWSIQPELLAADLKLAPVRLVVYCREIGCKVYSLSLFLPLSLLPSPPPPPPVPLFLIRLCLQVKSQPAVDVVGGKRYKATLVAPLKFPEPPKKRARGGT